MAKFPGLTLTTKGINMIVKSQAGSELIFTKMQLGDGEIGTSEDIKALTALKNTCLTANISTIDQTSDSGQIALTAIVSNSALANGFFARELGVWAKIGTDGEEQLYAYSNAGNYTTYIPDKTEPIDENKIKATIVIGNASSVSAVINASIVYVTKEMLDAHNADTTAHAAAFAAHTDEFGVATLKRSHTYTVGDIAYSNHIPSWARLECVTAGTTAATEPAGFSTVSTGGVLLVDGSAQWIVDDIRDATPVGAVTGRLYLPAGYVKANGATVQRADYPRLVAMADKYSLWTSDTTANIGMFGAGDGSTTMVLPNWAARMAQYADTAGGTVAAGLPNITSTKGPYIGGATGQFGAVIIGNTPGYGFANNGGGDFKYVTIDASKSNAIYGASATVQPPAVNVLAVMRY